MATIKEIATNKALREFCEKQAVSHVKKGLECLDRSKSTSGDDAKKKLSNDSKGHFCKAQRFTMFATMSDAELKVLRLIEPDLGWVMGDKMPSREHQLYTVSICKMLASESLHPSYKDHAKLVEKLNADHKIPSKHLTARKEPHKTAYALIHLVDRLNTFSSGRVQSIMNHQGRTQSQYLGGWCQSHNGFDTHNIVASLRQVTPDPKHEIIKMIKDYASKVSVTSKIVNPIIQADKPASN